MEFKASLDRLAKIITIVVTVLFTVIIVCLYFCRLSSSQPSDWFVTIVLVVVYFSVYLYHPLKYSITEDYIIVHRIAGNHKIRRPSVMSVEILDKNELSGTLRTMGVGGLFGYFGSFNSVSIGDMTWYVTRRDHSVLLRTFDNEKFLLSPDDYERFASVLKSGLSK